MALRALGRSRVITATPFGWTLPLTNSSAPAMAAKVRREIELEMELMWKRLSEGRLRERENEEDLNTNCEALNPSKLCMFLCSLVLILWRADGRTRPVQRRTGKSRPSRWPLKRRRFSIYFFIFIFIGNRIGAVLGPGMECTWSRTKSNRNSLGPVW